MSDTADKPRGRYKLPAGPGRPKGVPNKVNRDIRALAQDYGPDAIRKLAVLGGLIPKARLRQGEKPALSEATQVVALSHILNRAYGFPSQPLSHSADESFEALLDRLEERKLTGEPVPKLLELEVAPDGSFEVVETEESDQEPEPIAEPEPAEEAEEPVTDWMTEALKSVDEGE